jgi:hypothetical protein
MGQVVQGDSVEIAQVDDLEWCILVGHGCAHAVDDIINIGVVPLGTPVAIDSDWLTLPL